MEADKYIPRITNTAPQCDKLLLHGILQKQAPTFPIKLRTHTLSPSVPSPRAKVRPDKRSMHPVCCCFIYFFFLLLSGHREIGQVRAVAYSNWKIYVENMQIYAINTMSLMCPGPCETAPKQCRTTAKMVAKKKKKIPNKMRKSKGPETRSWTKLMAWQRQPHWWLDL